MRFNLRRIAPSIFALAILVTTITSSLVAFAPQKASAYAVHDMRFYFHMEGSRLVIRGEINGDHVATWTPDSANLFNYSPSFLGDTDSMTYPQGGIIRRASQLPDIHVGSDPRQAELRGGDGGVYDGYDISLDHSDYVASYKRCRQEGTPTSACVSGQSTSDDDEEGGGGDDEEEEDPSCESEGGDMSWILCPVLGVFDSALEWFDRQIEAMLTIPDSYLVENENMRRAGGRIRNIAYSILIPIMLVMVISTALGFEFISAYTVKRAMPRFAIAVVFIAVSWQIVTFLVMFFNDVGRGTMGLIQSSITGAGDISLSSLVHTSEAGGVAAGGVGLLALVAGAGAIAVGVLSIGIILSYALVAFLALFMAYAILVFRQMLIVFLALLAPLAILAWIFPGNDKLWKLWWGTFSKLLIMFPLIAGLIAIGKVFAHIVDQSDAQGVGFLIALIAYIGPYFFIPSTFKFAGGIFATVSGMANDKSRGLFDRAKNSRAKQREKLREQARIGKRWKNGPNSLNRFAGGVSNVGKAGLNPLNMRRNMRTAMGDIAMQQSLEQGEKNADYQSWKGDDDLNKAAWGTRNESELRERMKKLGYAGYTSEEKLAEMSGEKRTAAIANNQVALQKMDMAASRVERVRKQVSQDTFDQMTLVSAVRGGTAVKDAGEMAEMIAVTGQGDAAKTATLVVQARDAAMRAGRVDQGGAGFGATFTAVSELQSSYAKGGSSEEARQAARATAKEAITGGAVNAQGGMELVGSRTKPHSVKAAMPILQQRLKDAQAEGEEAYGRELARAANLYDSMSSSSPQNAEVLAHGGRADDPDRLDVGLMNYKLANGKTVQEEIEAYRTAEAGGVADGFAQMRREYGRGKRYSSPEEEAAASRRPEGPQGGDEQG
jgi:hypothetical protein